jgi:hypothetical protein
LIMMATDPARRLRRRICIINKYNTILSIGRSNDDDDDDDNDENKNDDDDDDNDDAVAARGMRYRRRPV